MPNLVDLTQIQTELWQKIPLTRAMALSIRSYEPTKLQLQAPLQLNINDKGTAFGGSLATLAITCGWLLLHLYLVSQRKPCDIAIQEANLIYSLPVTSELIAEAARPEPQGLQKILSMLDRKGKTRIGLEIVIKQNQQIATTLTAQYVISTKKD